MFVNDIPKESIKSQATLSTMVTLPVSTGATDLEEYSRAVCDDNLLENIENSIFTKHTKTKNEGTTQIHASIMSDAYHQLQKKLGGKSLKTKRSTRNETMGMGYKVCVAGVHVARRARFRSSLFRMDYIYRYQEAYKLFRWNGS